MEWDERPAELGRALVEQPVVIPGQHGKLYGIFTPPHQKRRPLDFASFCSGEIDGGVTGCL